MYIAMFVLRVGGVYEAYRFTDSDISVEVDYFA